MLSQLFFFCRLKISKRRRRNVVAGRSDHAARVLVAYPSLMAVVAIRDEIKLRILGNERPPLEAQFLILELLFVSHPVIHATWVSAASGPLLGAPSSVLGIAPVP